MSAAIQLEHVEKTYRGRVHALRGISLTVERGSIFGLLGPNGAGKSTLVKIMLSVIRPSFASGALLGQPIGHKPTLARVGFLPEAHRFPRYLTGRQILDFFGALTLVGRRARRQRAEQLLDLVGMRDAADRRIGTYSKGMAQRIGLAQALINDPELVILDEPTDGVDPVARRQIRDVLADLRAAGKTVFINSHLLSELELVCDRVAILVAGRVATQGTLDELAITRQWYEIELAQNGATPTSAVESALGIAFAERIERRSPQNPRVMQSIRRGTLQPDGNDPAWIEWDGQTLRVGVRDAEPVQPMLDRLRSAGLVVRRLQPVRPTLEDLFIEALKAHETGAEP
jgi:ABC-2 type transport system ATP-binding protein